MFFLDVSYGLGLPWLWLSGISDFIMYNGLQTKKSAYNKQRGFHISFLQSVILQELSGLTAEAFS